MSKRQFTDTERYAVFTVHGENCYLCGKPIDLLTMEVDHIIPESIETDPDAFAAAKVALGLADTFELQSFENWLPACRPCNLTKSASVFVPSGIVQIFLQRAREKATEAAELAQRLVGRGSVTKAWNIIKRASDQGALTDDVKAAITEFVRFHVPQRNDISTLSSIRLTPWLKVLSEANGIRVSKGPYGIGGGPKGPLVDSSFICSNCGSSAWNGARCVGCGMMDDD